MTLYTLLMLDITDKLICFIFKYKKISPQLYKLIKKNNRKKLHNFYKIVTTY